MQYNPPYTLPWLRRNEIALELAPVEAAAEEAVPAAAVAPEPEATEAAEAVEAADDGSPSD